MRTMGWGARGGMEEMMWVVTMVLRAQGVLAQPADRVKQVCPWFCGSGPVVTCPLQTLAHLCTPATESVTLQPTAWHSPSLVKCYT